MNERAGPGARRLTVRGDLQCPFEHGDPGVLLHLMLAERLSGLEDDQHGAGAVVGVEHLVEELLPLFGRRVAPDYFFALLHVGIFVVFFPAIFVAQKRVGSANRKDFWKVVTKGSPDGLRYLLYFFFAYAFVNFAIFMAQAPTGKQTGETPAVVWRGFSGHWMVFYCASFVILSSTLHSSRRRS